MTDTPLPERKIPDEKIEEYRDFYVELLGFVPRQEPKQILRQRRL